MQEVALHQSAGLTDDADRDAHLKRVLDHLESENSQLKSLVVRLSETIIRNVTSRR